VIYTPIAGDPARARILPVQFPKGQPVRIDPAGPRSECEIAVYPSQALPSGGPSKGKPLHERTGPGSTT
jgi:hypothetical protein